MKLLKKGSTIGIIAPAGALKKEDLDEAISFIKNNGWNYILGKNIFNLFSNGYNYSGTIQERKDDLQSFLDSDSIDAIWCARGGYGGAQFIDSINFDSFIKNPKFVIGYSDNTVIHQAINNLNLPSLHAITAKKLPSGNIEDCYNTLKNCLENGTMNYSIKPHKLNQFGKTNGILVGGNLSIINSLLGSKTITDFKDKILFLEDWNENYYSIDRMLTTLKRAGVFDEIKGLIFGSFTKLESKEDNTNFDSPFDPFAVKLISNLVGKRNYPICFNFPAGHIPDNKCLILGQEVSLQVSESDVKLFTK